MLALGLLCPAQAVARSGVIRPVPAAELTALQRALTQALPPDAGASVDHLNAGPQCELRLFLRGCAEDGSECEVSLRADERLPGALEVSAVAPGDPGRAACSACVEQLGVVAEALHHKIAPLFSRYCVADEAIAPARPSRELPPGTAMGGESDDDGPRSPFLWALALALAPLAILRRSARRSVHERRAARARPSARHGLLLLVIIGGAVIRMHSAVALAPNVHKLQNPECASWSGYLHGDGCLGEHVHMSLYLHPPLSYVVKYAALGALDGPLGGWYRAFVALMTGIFVLTAFLLYRLGVAAGSWPLGVALATLFSFHPATAVLGMEGGNYPFEMLAMAWFSERLACYIRGAGARLISVSVAASAALWTGLLCHLFVGPGWLIALGLGLVRRQRVEVLAASSFLVLTWLPVGACVLAAFIRPEPVIVQDHVFSASMAFTVLDTLFRPLGWSPWASAALYLPLAAYSFVKRPLLSVYSTIPVVLFMLANMVFGLSHENQAAVILFYLLIPLLGVTARPSAGRELLVSRVMVALACVVLPWSAWQPAMGGQRDLVDVWLGYAGGAKCRAEVLSAFERSFPATSSDRVHVVVVEREREICEIYLSVVAIVNLASFRSIVPEPGPGGAYPAIESNDSGRGLTWRQVRYEHVMVSSRTVADGEDRTGALCADLLDLLRRPRAAAEVTLLVLSDELAASLGLKVDLPPEAEMGSCQAFAGRLDASCIRESEPDEPVRVFRCRGGQVGHRGSLEEESLALDPRQPEVPQP